MIVPSTLLLLCGQVAPVILLVLAIWRSSASLFPAACATFCAYYPRLEGVKRFGQPAAGALFHPIGMLILVAIQWYGLLAFLSGRARSWKGRTYRTS